MTPMPSYVAGTSDTPLLYQTIGNALDTTADQHGDREALIVRHQNIRWTYHELRERADTLAAGLIDLGLIPGDRVGLWAPNCAEWVLTQFATAKAGLVLVNINPAYRLSELEYALNKVGCKALILASEFKSSDYTGMLTQLAPEIEIAPAGKWHAKQLPDLKHAISLSDNPPAGFIKFAALSENPSPAAQRKLSELSTILQPDDAINIQFTSGTTGFPKGATLSHHSILNNGYFVAKRQSFTHNDKLCIPVPLYHCFGMVMGVLGCVTHGACMVFPGEAFEPVSVLEAIQAEQCSALYGVPTMFIAELEHPQFKEFDLSSLRTGAMAGSPCPIEVMKRVITEMHMSEVTIAYGMTETAPVSFQSKKDDPIGKRVSTVGQIHPFVEVKIVDKQGCTVNRGMQGELCTRGYSVMLGYWNDTDRTNEAIDTSGWMHTGDLAVMDDDGYANITGRLKDMIIRGGENIYPREIEEFLYTHPAVQDVQVFGIPDDKFGEEVCAWIILRAGEKSLSANDVTAFCNGKIAHYKVPRHIKFVDTYPMTVTGKIQKFVMRETMREELSISEVGTA
ncbi:AMP-binding protein [Kordiimonas aquimaris]|uniref:AMP-binding protein n=1 Tax=Kordiimonas aquimaris TaxID=707591 RepID=UPI0021D36C7B|nr:AMP-binding protein [Kordiimonas aquimaris]